MPIYEYKCATCESQFEYMQRITEDPRTECESCGGALERLLSLTSFQLKGSGWYRDLYSSPKPEASGGSGGAESSDGASASNGASEGGGSSESGSKGEGSGSSKSEKSAGTAKSPAS